MTPGWILACTAGPGASSAHRGEALLVVCPTVQNWEAGWPPIPVCVRLRGCLASPCSTSQATDPLLFPCLVPSSRPGHSLSPISISCHGAIAILSGRKEAGRGEGFIICKGTKADG